MTAVRFNEAWTVDRREMSWADHGASFGLTSGAIGLPDAADRRKEIVDLLLGWRSDPSDLVREEMEPPSVELLDNALRIVDLWRKRNESPPDRVVPNAEGGLAFEWYREPWDWDLELFRDGSAIWQLFRDGKRVQMTKISWRPV